MLVPRDDDLKSYKQIRSKIAVSANFGGKQEIMHFRRFIVDFSVITPNWIVKFQYVDEKNTIFHMI